MYPTIYYLQTNIICIAILAIVFVVLKGKDILPERKLIFKRMIIATFLICLSDIGSWIFKGTEFVGTFYILYFVNGLYFFSITWAGYLWLRYVHIRTAPSNKNTRKRNFLYSIPIVIMSLLLLTNPVTNILYTIDENNIYARGDYVFIHWIITWGYLFWATIKVIIAYKKEKSITAKKDILPLIWFVVPPLCSAIVQMIYYGVTSTQVGITLSLLIIIITVYRDEISTDTLTGLNNRRAFDKYLAGIIERGSVAPTLFMCDVNNFKTINDTLGHAKGDHTLKRIASVLKLSCEQSPANPFLFRFGGDEFVICGLGLSAYEAQEIRDSIKKNMEIENEKSKDDISLSISIGEACGTCSTLEEIEMLISVADADMYKDKQKFKAASILSK